jgi:hypothetical protein
MGFGGCWPCWEGCIAHKRAFVRLKLEPGIRGKGMEASWLLVDASANDSRENTLFAFLCYMRLIRHSEGRGLRLGMRLSSRYIFIENM